MPVTDPESRVAALIASGERQFSTEFLAALVVVRRGIDLARLAELLEQSRFDEAFAVVGRAAARLGMTWGDVYTSAAARTGDWLTSRQELGEIVVRFDRTHWRAVAVMQENQLRLVREFTEAQRAATRQALVRGIAEGVNPRDAARAFRDSVGLTQTQERWVHNYERNLRELDRRALRRALRDRRFDSSVRRAIEDGKPLTDGQVRKMVARYRDRAVKYRSEVIARTEALRATHQGVREMYDQAIDAGQIDPAQLVSIWNTAGDERVRDFSSGAQTSHVTMHLQERAWGEPFTSGAGNQAFDPGTFGLPEEDAQCRCVKSTRILTREEAGIAAAVVSL